MPNTFAYVVLFLSPLVIFAIFRLLSVQVAVAVTVIGGYLFLPLRPTIDLPLVPAFDKDLVPATVALLFAGMAYGRQRHARILAERLGKPCPPLPFVAPGLWPRSALVSVLVVLISLGSLGTALTNQDPIPVGAGVVLPALRLYDFFSLVMSLIASLLPMLLARKYLADPEGHRILLTAIALFGFAYCFPALLEIRISPQLSNMIYGFFPHDFEQHVRNGGYRPAVFLNHALWVGILLAMAFLSALAVMRIKSDASRLVWFSIAGFILVTLLLSKTLGAFLLAVLLAPVVMFLRPRAILLICVGVSMVILLYPLLRGSGVIPVEAILSLAAEVNPARAGSLGFRIRNEDELLANVLLRQWFGWGGWGRGKIYDIWTGKALSVVDGVWIIQILVGGWVRYIGIFGLMILPTVLLLLGRRRLDLALSTVLLCVVLLINLIDMLPNGTLTPMSWLLVGALVGRLEYRPAAVEAQEPAAPLSGSPVVPPVVPPEVPLSRYTRGKGQTPKPRKSRGALAATPRPALRRPR